MFTDTLNMEARCVIIGAAPIFTGAEEIRPSDFVIVCDGGLAHAQAAGIRFDVLLGDFDSWNQPIPTGDFTTVTLPVEKDDTDLMYAVRYALKRGYQNFLLLGVFGGRTDHFLGNLSVGARIAEEGGLCVLFGANERLYILKDNALELTRTTDTIVSLLPLGDQIEHVSMTGFYYPLSDATLTKDFPLGISNQFSSTDETAVIQIGCGTAIIVVTQEQKP